MGTSATGDPLEASQSATELRWPLTTSFPSGEYDRAVIQPVRPPRAQTCRPVVASHTLIELSSKPEVATRRPSGDAVSLSRSPTLATHDATRRPLGISQMMTSRFLSAVTARRPSPRNATPATLPLWPFNFVAGR